ncbi:integral membrane protein [Streptomyces laurentii]|uniref:Integral membrane protein n=1 Tax=Streptomyces laurentii TaxID=39478 RepID=A0A169NN19_STRLU|nr:integral membrane protein [Streptomyces laurentii]
MSAPALAPRMLRAAVFTAVCVVLGALGHALAACAGIAAWSLIAGLLGVFGVTVLFTGRERSLPSVVGALTVGQLALHALFGLGQRPLGQGTGTGTGANDALVRLAATLVCGRGAVHLSPAEAARIVGDAGIGPFGSGAATGATGTGAMTGGATTGGVNPHLAHAMGAADPAAGLLPSLPMLLGHLLAALATGWLLRRGDLALGRLVRLSAEGAAGVAGCALVRSLRAALSFVRALLAGLPAAPATGPRGPARTSFDSSPPPVVVALADTVIRRGPPAAARCALALAA